MSRTKETVAVGEGYVIIESRCHRSPKGWSPPELAASYTLVFVRRGSFSRRLDGDVHVLDPVSSYFEVPGKEQQIAHTGPCGDVCTAIALNQELASLLGVTGAAEPATNGEPTFTPVESALAVQVLTRQSRSADPFELTEAIARVVSMAVSGSKRPPGAARASTEATHRDLVDTTKEVLTHEPATSLLQLAQRLSVSPHHLSRIFQHRTGLTLSAYRNQLRVRQALDRLGEGDESLTDLAADLGFADHAHLSRTVRHYAGAAPSTLRRLFASSSS